MAAEATQRRLTTAISTTALVTSRSQTIVVGVTSSKRDFAMPAPNCTDKMPISTSHTGETRRSDESLSVTGSI